MARGSSKGGPTLPPTSAERGCPSGAPRATLAPPAPPASPRAPMARTPPIVVPLLLAGAMAAALSARAPVELTGGRHPREIAANDALPTAAQRPAQPGETPVRGDTAVLSLLSDIDGFNPFTSSSREASEIQDLLFPRLMHEEADYFAGPPSFTPYLAERWEAGADGRSIRCRRKRPPRRKRPSTAALRLGL